MAFALLTLVPKIFAMPILLVEDIVRLFRHFPPRSVWVSELALLIGAIPFVSLIYGMTGGRHHYKVHRTILKFKNLPKEFDGFTITQLSDIHAGSFTSKRGVEKGINLVNKQKSDVILFTGDLVNNQASEMTPWIDTFAKLSAPLGKYSVLGNHDYGDYVKWQNEGAKRNNLEQLKAYHQQLGFKLLLDEHVEIHKNGQKIILAGVENWGIGFGERGDLKKALNGTNAADFKVLLSHDPTHWAAEVVKSPSKVHLTLSGHTHGMQFGLEAFGIKWSPVKYRYAHWAGVTGQAGIFLNINRGFGFIGFSGRIGIWPEITVIELKKTAVVS